MSKLSKALIAAAGNSGGAGLTVEDVFSTYLYTGNATAPSAQTITNGINLADEGGLVWTKERNNAAAHLLIDTERGLSGGFLETNTTDAADTTRVSESIASFNTDGYTLHAPDTLWDRGSYTYASWTFRKAEKFFDVVTYTGTGSGIKVIDHNLGSAPAVIFVKKTNSSQDWLVFSKDTSQPHNKYLKLNTTDAELNYDNIWGENGYLPTDTQFKVQHLANESSSTYVAYLFASDAGGFGDDGSESIIKCGSYTGAYPTQVDVDCGFEPQWLLVRPATTSSDWSIFDNMRGVITGSSDEPWLDANTSSAEGSNLRLAFNANGFSTEGGGTATNANGQTHIYIAIRRPMKTPESGTEVFSTVARTATGATYTYSGNDFPIDMVMQRQRSVSNTVDQANIFDRLRGATKSLSTAQTQAEETNSGITGFDYQDGYVAAFGSWSAMNWVIGSTEVYWNFKRATGFFDVVAYTGNGSGAKSFNHNLGVIPELMIVKGRNYTDSWYVYVGSLGSSNRLKLNTDAASGSAGTLWNNTSPTATQFTVGSGLNVSAETNITYLFATLAGVSKVGSYTGTGSNVNVDCGFSAGARFVLIKRTDSTGDWYVWDSVRGIVAGNDPYLLLNSTAAEVTSTDYIDPLASGFTVTSSAPAALNASGGSFVYLAIA